MKFCPREPHYPPPPHLLFVEPKVYDPWAPRQVQAAGQAMESKKEIFGIATKIVKAFPVAANKMPAKKKAKPAKTIVKASPVAARKLLQAIQRRRR